MFLDAPLEVLATPWCFRLPRCVSTAPWIFFPPPPQIFGLPLVLSSWNFWPAQLPTIVFARPRSSGRLLEVLDVPELPGDKQKGSDFVAGIGEGYGYLSEGHMASDRWSQWVPAVWRHVEGERQPW